jgi:imidazolonepropionase-like amidohydrolase
LGINSVKVYTHARSSELAAVIQTAHRHGVRVTGHLCAVGFSEAANLGIDNLEHGLIVDTEFYSERQPNRCPDQTSVVRELAQMDIHGPPIQGLIQTLVQHHVAVTSTLPVFESFSSLRLARLDERPLPMLVPNLHAAWRSYAARTPRDPDDLSEKMLKKEMEFEREFVNARGVLMAGTDPTGWGGVIAGFGDQRELELLVEAGFVPEQAVKIATYNGALFLGQGDRIGTLAKGKNADLIVIKGNPAREIRDIEHTEIVFRDGVGYDSAAILKTIVGRVGRQ